MEKQQKTPKTKGRKSERITAEGVCFGSVGKTKKDTQPTTTHKVESYERKREKLKKRKKARGRWGKGKTLVLKLELTRADVWRRKNPKKSYIILLL